MRESAIPVKTAAGRLEVDERKHKLGARHRMVLISINGERSVAGIRQQFAAIHEIDSVLEELAADGMIEVADGEVPASPSDVVTAPPPELRPAPAPVAETASRPARGDDEGLRAAREFMSKMLAAKVGLRAFLFTQKIEKCPSRQVLREYLPEFRRALRKSVDAGRVAEFSAHVEELIGEG
jgi:hypothetical protein